MPSIARKGDEVLGTCFQAGHGHGNPPQACTGTITGGSGDTFNVAEVARKGDTVQLNCTARHTTTITGGSSSVFVNSIECARLGDAVGNGSDFIGSINSASSNAFAGG